MSDIKLNIIFPVGQKPNINFCESKFAEKDCYVYWDMEYLKLRPICMPEQDIKHKEIYGINSMINAVKNLEQQNKQLREENKELREKLKFVHDRYAILVGKGMSHIYKFLKETGGSDE